MKDLCTGKTTTHICFSGKTIVNIFIVLLFILISAISCTQSDDFIIGQDFVESQTNVKILDTFTIDLSTVLLDSIVTSGKGVALVGNYKDEEFGSVGSKSYFELGFPEFDAIEDVAVYDSAVFILSYSGYSYGDTSASMSLSIHQLEEREVLKDDGYLYSNSTFKYSIGALGTKIFYPEPNSADTIVSVPVQEFGRRLFSLIKRADESVSTSESFLDYLKGFVITSEAGVNSAIIGFLADEDHILLRIYYHTDTDAPESRVITIPFGNKDIQFSSIQYDLTDTPLNTINSSNNVVLSSETGNKAFLQGLVGLLPKIQFPTLQNLLLENRWKIVKAELIFKPVKNSYNTFRLPEKLYLYDTYKNNEMNSILLDDAGDALVSSLYVDQIFNEDTRYTFNITQFITSEFSDSYFDFNHGIFVGLEGTEMQSSFGRLIIEGTDPPVKLKLYYLTY
jgi:hypothetical protein